jgi:hypothetical protein
VALCSALSRMRDRGCWGKAEFSGIVWWDRLRCSGRGLPPPRLAREVPRMGDVLSGEIFDDRGGGRPPAAGVVVG